MPLRHTLLPLLLPPTPGGGAPGKVVLACAEP